MGAAAPLRHCDSQQLLGPNAVGVYAACGNIPGTGAVAQ
jgi:hypothetical protein